MALGDLPVRPFQGLQPHGASRGDPSNPLTGLFNTRSPNRPAPLALSLVRVVSVEGAALRVTGLEAMDGSPVLDLKPFNPSGDMPRED